MKRTYYLEVILVLLLLCFNFFVETGEAVFYFFSACLLFYLFIKSKSGNNMYIFKTKRNLFYLLCGLLFIFCAGEEISWGQRIFNIASPQYFYESNYQQEINFHNLPLFGFINQHHTRGIQSLFTSNAMLYQFFFFFWFLVPLLHKYSKKIRNLTNKTGFPVIPLWIGFLFPINFIIQETIERVGLIGYFQIGEISEYNFAAIALIGVLSLLNEFRLETRKIGKGRPEPVKIYSK
jgi:hypothetical protein